MKRLDSMTLRELTKLFWRSRFLISLGYLLFFAAFISVLSTFFMILKPPTELGEHVTYAGIFFALIILALGFQLVYVRSSRARQILCTVFFVIFILFLFSLIISILSFSSESSTDKSNLSVAIMLSSLPIFVSLATWIILIKSKDLFGPESVSHRQIVEARKKKMQEIPFTDEELPPKLEYSVLAKISPSFLVLGIGGLFYLSRMDYQTSEQMDQLRRSAEQGDSEAQYQLALCYENGINVEKDMETAVYWLRNAADQGNADAQAELSGCYLSGLGVPKDITESVKWMRKAAEQGTPTAQYLLGKLYGNGELVEQDLPEAVKWMRMAAEQGLPDAQAELGIFYMVGMGVPEDTTEGLKLIRNAVDQGSALGQYNLSTCYANGFGVEKDMVEAVKWMRMAADQGLAAAQAELGLYYLNGAGIPQNKTEGLKWIRMAADQGDLVAKQILEQQQ